MGLFYGHNFMFNFNQDGIYDYVTLEYMINMLDYIPIANVSEFNKFNLLSNVQYMGANSPWYRQYQLGRDKNYVVIYNLDFENQLFTPSETSFSGIFDGNRVKINNANILKGGGLVQVGLIGGIQVGSSTIIRNVIIEDSVSESALLGSMNGSALSDAIVENCSVSGTAKDGLLLDRNFGTVRRCNSFGVVNGGSGSNISAGGLVGSSSAGEIYKCYSEAIINSELRVGGLVGNFLSTYMHDCYTQSTVNSTQYGGGAVGGAFSGQIKNCYAIGTVSGSGILRGLVGGSGATVINSYYDTTVSGLTDTGTGIPKTTAEMKQQATYVGWDFTNIWSINEGVSYPELINI